MNGRSQDYVVNSNSTGGAGYVFESHVQSSFVTLLLSSGRAPCFPNSIIEEIQLQAGVVGYKVDDIVVTLTDITTEKTKILGQIKLSIDFTKSSTEFENVIKAAWEDYNNSQLFTKGKDIIALITGSLSSQDYQTVQYLLHRAKSENSAEDFFSRLNLPGYTPYGCETKLQAFKKHLNKANQGKFVSNSDVFEFLRHFHVFVYDLEHNFEMESKWDSGVVLSLLLSHISQHIQEHPEDVWSRIVNYVQGRNKSAATITLENIPPRYKKEFGLE